MNKRISGSGGGKSGGGGGGISEDADTLSGVSLARFVDLIGEGEIDGLVNGERSVYLDGVALRSIEGTPNYKPFRWNFTPGTPDQLPIPGFSGTSSEVSVGVQLTKAIGAVSRPVTDADADSIRINLSVNGLSQTDSKGKVSTTSVAYTIRARRQTGSWVVLKQGVIDGKTGSRYPKSEEVSLETVTGTGAFDVSVERITDDSASALLINALYWDSFTIINYERYSYPSSALFALELDARYFSAIPSRSYHVRGLHVRVPTNYNPVTRVYTGIWDGNFKWAYSNNPAWCYFDLLTSPRYGLGRRISDNQIDKWELYSIGQYCDEPVLTGLSTNISDIISDSGVNATGQTIIGVPQEQGPSEPRFTLNCVLNSADDAYRVIAQLTSVFRGMSYWAASGVAMSQDRPRGVSMIWNNSNVIDSRFVYQGSSRSQRHTVVSVAWNDPAEDFRQRFEYVEDRDGIQRYGVRPIDIVAFGCTSRSQARRVGLWLLFTERLETDAIVFQAGLDSSQVVPGEVGQIMDARQVGARWGGRVASATISSITIDAPLPLDPGTYVLAVKAKDGSLMRRSVEIEVGATLTIISVAEPPGYSGSTVFQDFSEVPEVNAIWALSRVAVVDPMYVRVVGVRPINPMTYEITVLRHNPSKYEAIDSGARLTTPTYSLLKAGTLEAVTGLIAVENSYRLATATTPVVVLEISWDRQDSLLTRGYSLLVTSNAGTALDVKEQSAASYTLVGIDPDTYTITVKPISHLGLVGANATTITVGVTGIDTRPPENVQEFTVEVINGGVRFRWKRPDDLSYLQTQIHIEAVWNDATPSLFAGDANNYTWQWPPAGTYTALIKHKDTSGNYSAIAASANFTVSESETASITLNPPSLTVAADADGVVTSYVGLTTTAKILLLGIADDTVNWTLAPTGSTGVTASATGSVVSLTDMTDATDAGYVDIVASRAGYPDLEVRWGVTKVKAGIPGIVMTLTPEILSLQAGPLNASPIFTGVTSVAKVASGGVDETGTWALTKVDTGVVSSIAGNVVSVTGYQADQVDDDYNDVVLQVPFTDGTTKDWSKYNRSPRYQGAWAQVAAPDGFYSGGGPIDRADVRMIWGSLDSSLVLSRSWSIKLRLKVQDLESFFGSAPVGALNYFGITLIKLSSTTFYFSANFWTTAVALSSGANIRTTGQWYEVEMNKSSDHTGRLFVDGALVGTATIDEASSPVPVDDLANLGTFAIGNTNSNSAVAFRGWIKDLEVRINGPVRTAAYTAPAPAFKPRRVVPTGYVDVTATKGGNTLNKKLTVVTREAAVPVISMSVDRSTIAVPADHLGNVTSFAGLSAYITLMLDGIDDTANWNLRAAQNFRQYSTFTLTGRTLSLTSLTTDIDSTIFGILAQKRGYPNQWVRVDYVKNRVAKTVLAKSSVPSITLNANYLGVVSSYAGASAVGSVTLDAVDDSTNWTATATPSSGITTSVSVRTVTVTAMADGTDSGYFDINLARAGYTTQVVRVPVTKIKALRPTPEARFGPMIIVLAGDTNGHVPSYAGATASLAMYLEGVDVSGAWTFTRTTSDAGLTTTITGGVVTITAIPDNVDAGWIDIEATQAGWPTTVVRITVSKSKLLRAAGLTDFGLIDPSTVVSSGGSAILEVIFKPDGEIWLGDGTTSFSIGKRWFNPTTTGIGASYWIRYRELNASSPSGLSGITPETWTSLASAVAITISRASDGTSYVNGTVAFATSSVGANSLTLGTIFPYVKIG